MDKIIEIYRQSFGNEPDFEKALFKNCGNYIKKLDKNGETVSILFLLPCEMLSGGTVNNAYYLFAAATHSDKRGKGYMSQLIERIKTETSAPIILRPANESLIKFYEKSGFYTLIGQDKTCTNTILNPIKGFEDLCNQTEKTDEGNFTLMAYNLDKNISEIFFPYTMP